MDNLCLIGLGLVGLLYLTSKKDEKIKEINETDNVFINPNGDKDTVTSEFFKNKYFNSTNLEWVIPVDEVNNYPLHPFAGLDYLKISQVPNTTHIFGRYIKLSESLKTLLMKLEPSVTIGNTIEYGSLGALTLVTCSHKLHTVSAITLNFAEIYDTEELSMCKMKSIYKKMVKDYTCNKTINPVIEWYNLELWGDNTYLYKNLCGEGDTSTLETNQMMETDVLNDSDTSDLEDDSDITSMDNQAELDEFIDSVTSESKKDSDITSMDNQEEIDKFIDSVTSESKQDSDNLILSVTSDDGSTNLDVISATSWDDTPKNEPVTKDVKKSKCSKKKCSKKKCSKKDSSVKKKKKDSSVKKKDSSVKKNDSSVKKKDSSVKKKDSSVKKKKKSSVKKKKKSSVKKKKSKKNKDSDLQGGSSSLTNTRKSILGRF